MPVAGTAVAIAVAYGLGTLLAARFALRSRVIG